MSLSGDGIVRETTKRCLVQNENGFEASEESIADETETKKKKVRPGTAVNTTKHLWAGAVAAMVSRSVWLYSLNVTLPLIDR